MKEWVKVVRDKKDKFTGHDRFVQDGSPTRAAAIGALLTDWASVREQKQVAVAFNSALALCATEATSSLVQG